MYDVTMFLSKFLKKNKKNKINNKVTFRSSDTLCEIAGNFNKNNNIKVGQKKKERKEYWKEKKLYLIIMYKKEFSRAVFTHAEMLVTLYHFKSDVPTIAQNAISRQLVTLI